jgi:hypothetical protein
MLATIPVHPLPEQLTPSPFTVQILVQFLQQTGQLPEPGILWEEQSKAQRSTPQKKMPKRSEVELYTKSNAYSRRGQLHAEVNQQTPYVSGNFLPCYNPCCPLPSLDFYRIMLPEIQSLVSFFFCKFSRSWKIRQLI